MTFRCYRCHAPVSPRGECACKDGCCLIHADCRDVLPQLEAGCVDLVLTDPPYPREFEHVWDYLNLVSCNSGFLVTLLGHYQLPYVLDTLRKTWEYYWCAVTNNNSCPIMHGFNVKVNWKPALIFRRGGARPQGIWLDNFNVTSKVKKYAASVNLHKWGQSEVLFHEPIRAFMPEDGLVVDPFTGGGTILRLAKDLSRRCIGIEIEEKYCEIAAERLRQGVLL